jgi:predicted DNA-binding transcriptional regulator YafY
VRALSLLELPVQIQDRVDGGELASTVAAELAKLPDAESQSEVAKLVQAVRARRPAPERRPDLVTIDLGDCAVTVRWKRASDTTALQALRKAVKVEQARESADERAA